MSYVVMVSDEYEEEGSVRRHRPTSYHRIDHSWRPNRRDKPGSLRDYRRGTKRHARYKSTGKLSHLNRALPALSAAVWGTARHLEQVDTTGPYWHAFANNLGVALFDGYLESRRLDLLDDAVEYLRRAEEALPSDSHDRARVLANLIEAVEARMEHPRGKTELPDLPELWQSLSSVDTAPIRVRLEAASAWGYAAAESGGPAAGLEGLERAVELLPIAAWWGYSRKDRETVLTGFDGLARDAAACALAAGRPIRAVELLDGGRAVLWKQLLMTRADRNDLRKVAPLLARRMDRVAAALERDSGVSSDRRMALARRWTRLNDRASVRLQQDWDSLASRAKSVLPDGSFTMPDFRSDILPSAAEGPVVIVNVSRFGCHALIVRSDANEPQVIDLEKLTESAVEQRVASYMSAMGGDAGAESQEVVTSTLAWLWDAVAGPVMEALGFRGSAAEVASLPRLWWCPTGMLGALPIHAAAQRTGRSPDKQAVLDRAISSYTPNAAMLKRARDRRVAGDHPAVRRLLHVSMSESDDRPPLPGAARNRALFEVLFPADKRTSLDASAATRTKVSKALARHAWVHFDCHGIQDLDRPFDSGLVLHDGLLTVADLVATRNDGAEFAFTAACDTAVSGPKMADEVITLAAAMLFAGHRSVIGIQLAVPDRMAARISKSVYDELANEGILRPALSAQALHEAIRKERTRNPEYPSAWVPFLHFGL